ncbi:MAG: TldD/PmbA family protein [Calditrichaeota bacterium]|nr:MAG: TldD/PmbA family protein [Calditrichota bacterium]
MLTKDQFADLSEKIIKLSPANETEVSYAGSENSLTRFSNNIITQNVIKKDESISILLVKEGKTSRVRIHEFDDESINKAFKNGMEIMSLSKEHDKFLPLPEAQKYQEIRNCFFEDTANFSPIERAEQISFAVKEAEAKKLSMAGIYTSGETRSAMANSNGLIAFDKRTNAQVSLTAQSETSYGWAEDGNRDVAKIDIEKATQTAIEKCLTSQNPTEIEPGKYDVVLEAPCVTDFLSYLNWKAFGGLAYLENRSFMAGKLGQKIFGENITIKENAFNEMNPGKPYDGEGMPKKPVTLIENGVLKEIVHDRYTAQKVGTESTGHGFGFPNSIGPYPSNLELSAGNSSLEEMIASTERGLLVTHFHYTNTLDHFNLILTGMTRDGLWLIENGKISRPVMNLRFTDSIPRVMNNIELISKELQFKHTFWGSGFVVPSIKVKDFNFSSKTER